MVPAAVFATRCSVPRLCWDWKPEPPEELAEVPLLEDDDEDDDEQPALAASASARVAPAMAVRLFMPWCSSLPRWWWRCRPCGRRCPASRGSRRPPAGS